MTEPQTQTPNLAKNPTPSDSLNHCTKITQGISEKVHKKTAKKDPKTNFFAKLSSKIKQIFSPSKIEYKPEMSLEEKIAFFKQERAEYIKKVNKIFENKKFSPQSLEDDIAKRKEIETQLLDLLQEQKTAKRKAGKKVAKKITKIVPIQSEQQPPLAESA